MKWNEISIHTSNEAEEAISNILNEYGANGVLIEDAKDLLVERSTRFGEIYDINKEKYPDKGINIKGYFVDNKAFKGLLDDIKKEISHLKNFGVSVENITYTISSVDEEDWSTSWKKYYKPTKVSKKFLVVPNWEEDYTLQTGEIKLVLDPGMAFGTGTHPTTMLSIQGLENVIKMDDLVIDVGCGSGVLSIASILLGANKVHAFDLDEVAINSTNINKRINNIENQIIAKENNLLKNIEMKANVIVANILAEIIVDLIEDAENLLLPKGYLVLSGIIDKKESLVREKLADANFNIIERKSMGHWVMIVAQKEAK